MRSARASQRAGELLKEIEKGTGGQPYQKSTGGSAPPSRKQAAAEAALSPDQAKDVVRVANMPDPLMDLTPPRSAWIGSPPLLLNHALSLEARHQDGP